MSGTSDLGKMMTLLSKYNNNSIKVMTVSLLTTVFVGHHFAQPSGAEPSRKAVSVPLSGSRRLRRREQLLLQKCSK